MRVMPSYFISDLHLAPDTAAINQRFLIFLEKIAPTADALYILGDFFEAWIGDDDKNEFVNKIITALRSLTSQGKPIYLMRGNRDFLLGKKFAESAACQLLEDPCLISLNGQRVLLMHGDLLCSADRSYQRYRKIVHATLIQKLFLALPLRLRRLIARAIRRHSQRTFHKKSSSSMDVSQATVEKFLHTYQAEVLIHGHTHRPAIHTINRPGKSVYRYVLPMWEDDQAGMLMADEDGFKLISC